MKTQLRYFTSDLTPRYFQYVWLSGERWSGFGIELVIEGSVVHFVVAALLHNSLVQIVVPSVCEVCA